MKLRHVWNMLLVLTSAWVGVSSMPLIIEQAKSALPIFGGSVSSLTEVSWLLSHIGLPLFFVLFLMSLGSWTWTIVDSRLQWFYAISAALILAGAIACLALDYFELQSVVFDYITYSAAAVAMSFPIVFLKTGWIGLGIRLRKVQ